MKDKMMSTPPAPQQKARLQKRADALRQNLQKRKQQARTRKEK
jgi:hypothetical protein